MLVIYKIGPNPTLKPKSMGFLKLRTVNSKNQQSQKINPTQELLGFIFEKYSLEK
jgi:hypothetical protein